ncbi:unnamed protein product [Moneuplotes crassus]|uniref:Macro domain-containing protein n=1 Tax=Euplotes crassus TaxID=5936 RepID=A0AAD2D1U0_EUPCR|nr:unnamed protein product [Moneuplotes crassus]
MQEKMAAAFPLQLQYKGMEIVCKYGDITAEETDAIVNAANNYLAHGGGVAGAISRKGGYIIDQESDEWVDKYGEVPTGETAYTSKGNLGCKKYCIHAVGPIYGYSGGENAEKQLELTIVNTYKRAEELKCESVSVPAISSGIFGYPLKECAQTFAKMTREYIDNLSEVGNLKKIVMCNIEFKTVKMFRDAFEKEFKDIIDEAKQSTEEAKEEVNKETPPEDTAVEAQDTKEEGDYAVQDIEDTCVPEAAPEDNKDTQNLDVSP